jgi:tripartite-type tricarboxylate transporter receptor subunit TctC
VSALRTCSMVCVLALSATATAAQTPTEFYSRNSVRLIISADPGGSYDGVGRLMARHLGKHIPGNPRVVPENMLGASGAGRRELYLLFGAKGRLGDRGSRAS